MPSSAILVTGATGTLGSAAVKMLCAAGHTVVGTFLSSDEKAAILQKETGCRCHQADLRNQSVAEALFQNPFRAVLHCAGWSRDSLLLRTSTADWQDTMKSNFDTAFLVTQAALHTLPAGGQILLVSSRVGQSGYPGQSAYAAAKGAVTGLMRQAALEGAERGIRVNAIFPAFVPSAMSEDLSDAVVSRRFAENLLPDVDGALSFAACARWLLETDAPVTGQVFRPDCRL